MSYGGRYGGGGNSYGGGGSSYGGGRRDGGRHGGGYGGGGGGRHRGRRGGRRNVPKNAYGIRRDQIGGKLVAVDWSRQRLDPFNRRIWTGQPNPPSPQQADEWRTKNQVFVEGENIPAPILSFHNTNLPETFIKKFNELGFAAPTPIQSQAWPMVLEGNDCVGIAETGSGKTLSFVLPGIIHIQGQPVTEQQWSRRSPIALVVAPTRELAIQIEAETTKFAYAFGISVACIYGGAPKRKQESAIRAGMQFLIATPGRLLDFLERGTFSLSNCSYCVFDEADRMLDMGFEPQIRALLGQVRPDRQMVMFSATWPKEVQKLAYDFLNPQKMKLKIGDDSKAAATVTQKVEVLDRSFKRRRLDEILRATDPQQKVLIFCGTKRYSDELARELQHYRYPAESIHGDKEQWRREEILTQFKSGQKNILVATDVASRGIDVKDLQLVINFDFPQNCEDYIHRVGRTGRAGNTGVAYTFFDPRNDAKHARKLVALLEKNNQEIPEQLRTISTQRGHGGGRSRHGKGRRDDRGAGGHGGGYGRSQNGGGYGGRSQNGGGYGGGHGGSQSYRPY